MFRAYSSVWEHLGRETRSAIQGTPSPTTRAVHIGDAVSLSAVSRLSALPALSLARALSRAPQARTAHTPHGAHRTP